jgi:hypothetical protein
MSLFINTNSENNQTNVQQDQTNVQQDQIVDQQEEYYCEKDVEYIIDEELENSYSIIHGLQEKYAEKIEEEYGDYFTFLELIQSNYWSSWALIYLNFPSDLVDDFSLPDAYENYESTWSTVYHEGLKYSGREEEVREHCLQQCLERGIFKEDVLVTHWNFLMSYVSFERIKQGIEKEIWVFINNKQGYNKQRYMSWEVIDDDVQFMHFVQIFGECYYNSEIIQTYNTIKSQKQRLPFCVVEVTRRCNSKYKFKHRLCIQKEYIEKAEEALYDLIQKERICHTGKKIRYIPEQNEYEEEEEPFDPYYIVDEEIENSYLLVYNLSNKYGEKFMDEIGSCWWTAWLATYDSGQARKCYGKEEKEEKNFKYRLKSSFGEDIHTTHYDFFLSHCKEELKYSPNIFQHKLKDDGGLTVFKWYFEKRCIYYSEVVKAYNTIKSQKQRLPFCVVKLTYNNNENKYRRNYFIHKDYIEKAEEILYNIIVEYELEEFISQEEEKIVSQEEEKIVSQEEEKIVSQEEEKIVSQEEEKIVSQEEEKIVSQE